MYGSWPPSIDPQQQQQQQGSTRPLKLPLSLQQKGLAASPNNNSNSSNSNNNANNAPSEWLATPSLPLPVKQVSTRLPPLNTLDYNPYHSPNGSLLDQSQSQSVSYQQHPPSHRQFSRQEYPQFHRSFPNPHHPPEKEPHQTQHALDVSSQMRPAPSYDDSAAQNVRNPNLNINVVPANHGPSHTTLNPAAVDLTHGTSAGVAFDSTSNKPSSTPADHSGKKRRKASRQNRNDSAKTAKEGLATDANDGPAQHNRNQLHQANNCGRKASSRTPSGATTVSSASAASSTPSSMSISRNSTRFSSAASLPTTVSSTSTTASTVPSKPTQFNSFRPRSPSDASLDDPATLGPRTHGKRLTVQEESVLFGICNKYASTFGERNQICAWYAKIGNEFTSRMDHQYSWHSVRRKVEEISRQQLALKEKREREGRSYDEPGNGDPAWKTAVSEWLPAWKKYVDQETERISMNQGKRGRKRKSNGPGFTQPTTEGSESPSTTEPATPTPDFPYPMIPAFDQTDSVFNKGAGVGQDMNMGDATATSTSRSSATATNMDNTAESNTPVSASEKIQRTISNPAGISAMTRPNMTAVSSSSRTPAAMTTGAVNQVQTPLGPAPTTSSTDACLAWPRMNKSMNSTSSSSPIINPGVTRSLWPHGPNHTRQQEQQTRHGSLNAGPTSFSPNTYTPTNMDGEGTRQHYRAQAQAQAHANAQVQAHAHNQHQQQQQQQQPTPSMRIHSQAPTPMHSLSRSMDLSQTQAQPQSSYGRQSSHQYMMPQGQIGATPSQLHPSIMTSPHPRLPQYQKPHQQQGQMPDNSRHVSAPQPHPAMGLYPYQTTNNNNNNNGYMHHSHSHSQSHSFPHPQSQSHSQAQAQTTNQLPHIAMSLPTTATTTTTGTSASASLPGHTAVAASAASAAATHAPSSVPEISGGNGAQGTAGSTTASPVAVGFPVPGPTLTQIRSEIRSEMKREMDRDRVQWEQKLEAMERDRTVLVQKLQHLENAQSMILTQLLRPNMG